MPFDSAHKFSAAHIKGKQDLILIKGAPERIVSACTRYYDEKGRARPLLDKSPVRRKWNEMTQNAVRVLALAVSDTPVTQKGNLRTCADRLVAFATKSARRRREPSSRYREPESRW